MRTTAAVLRHKDQPYSLEEVVLRDPLPTEVRVRIAGVGLCHTDLMPRAGLSAPPPIIVGHEGSGVVEVVGSEVRNVVVGDHVVISFDSCGRCLNCLAAAPAYCDTFVPRNLVGVGPAPGGVQKAVGADGETIAADWFGQSSFAQHVVCSARNVVRVDPIYPIELLGPLACGVQTGAGAVMNSLSVRAGDSVVVFGAGSVGLSAVMAARVVGATTIIAVDLNEGRLALAEKLGATQVIVSGPDVDVAKQVRRSTGRGSDFALDTTGVPGVIGAAIDGLRPTGVCGLVGAQRQDLTIGPAQIAFGKTVKGIIEGDAVPGVFIPKLLALWSQGRFPFDTLIETYPLSDINAAEKAMHHGDVVKPVLIP